MSGVARPGSDRSSFTQRIIAELAPHIPPLACCRRSLIDGMCATSAGDATLATTRLIAARVALQALHACSVPAHVERAATARRTTYRIRDADLSLLPPPSARACCMRARVRGAFLAAGRLSGPDLEPHLEIGMGTPRSAVMIASDLATLGVAATPRSRRGRWLVTVRSASQVGRALSSIGAQSGRLEFEAGRVIRDVHGSVNRRLNAETANLRRTAGAGVRQLEAILALAADPERWEQLAPALREAAVLREHHPDDDLTALAARAGCSRSAMAGRMARLLMAAHGPRASVERPRERARR